MLIFAMYKKYVKLSHRYFTKITFFLKVKYSKSVHIHFIHKPLNCFFNIMDDICICLYSYEVYY